MTIRTGRVLRVLLSGSLSLFAADFLGAACAASGNGTLMGTVSFVGVPCGPETPSPTVPPCDGPYPGYELVVFNASGGSEAGRVRSDDHGSYSLELPSGTYVIYRPSGSDEKETIRLSVVSGNTLSLDLRIDTGVR